MEEAVQMGVHRAGPFFCETPDPTKSKRAEQVNCVPVSNCGRILPVPPIRYSGRLCDTRFHLTGQLAVTATLAQAISCAVATLTLSSGERAGVRASVHLTWSPAG